MVFSVAPSARTRRWSLSSVTSTGRQGPAREVTIEYLDANGFGSFLRR